MSAQIFRLDDYRPAVLDHETFDLATAVDAAIRDLREILRDWGTDTARIRAAECERMLTRALELS